jgi:ComF family protein
MIFRTGVSVSGAIARLFRQSVARAADLVFPPSCLACRKAIETANGLCSECWRSVRFIERPFCERLGTPFPVDLGAEGLVSPDAIANPPVYDRARAVAHFDDGPVRRLVHRFKYGDRLELARAMGAWMARAGDELLTGADVLIPVPLHRGRLASRRFNQAAMLAHVISEHSGVPADAFSLTRIKPTPRQVGLTRSQRAANVQGAFLVPPHARFQIEGKAAVLIDDVLTSGATINAASRALLRAGAARVDVLVFARVVTG